MYDWLFPSDIHTHLHQTEASARNDGYNLRLRMRIENPTIASLPLEFLYREKGNYYLRHQPRYRPLALSQPALTPGACP